MDTLSNLRQLLCAGRSVWIAGAGKSGLAVARLLRKHGFPVFLTENRQLSEAQQEELRQNRVPFEHGGHDLEALRRSCAVLVLSPGIPLDYPICDAARSAGAAIVSEIEVASWFLPKGCSICAVTGTNGKSTVSNYLAQLLGDKGIGCGNLGRPLADVADSLATPCPLVVEMSSYQLETTWTFRPDVSILLNLQEDHLARYGTMDAYLRAKWRLVHLTRDSGLVIIDRDMLAIALKVGLALPRARVAVVTTSSPSSMQNSLFWDGEIPQLRTLPLATYRTLDPFALLPHGAFFAEILVDSSKTGAARVDFRSERWASHVEIADPCLPGRHNAVNIAFASAAALDLGISTERIVEQWSRATSNYQHIPHRLEDAISAGQQCRDRNGTLKRVRIVNDSKATNVESVKVAVESYAQPVRLLLGGDPKDDDFARLAPYLGSPVIRVYPFGKAREKVMTQIGAVAPDRLAPPQPTLRDAAELALADAQDDDIILLSPGCASFDEFRNFEHRGDIFKEWARAQIV